MITSQFSNLPLSRKRSSSLPATSPEEHDFFKYFPILDIDNQDNPYKICYLFFSIFNFFSLEISRINLSSDQKNNKYYVGEVATITASIHNPSAVLSMTWQRETEYGRYTIDTSLPEYSGSKLTIDEQRLVIRNCKESDRGTYILLAACIENTEVDSNNFFLDIVQGK